MHEGSGWINSEGKITTIKYHLISFLKRELTNIRQVEDQDNHLMCQTLCADTAHCIGYTFVEVAFDVGGVGILVVVLVLGGALAVVVIVAVIQHP